MASDPRTPSGSAGDAAAQSPDAQRMEPGTYAWLAGGGLLVSIGLLLFLVFQADRIVASGLDHRVFYVLLIPLGLAAGSFAYGAMGSTAGFTGTMASGEVRLTGPAVFAGLVVVGGFFLVPEGGSVTLVVRVQAEPEAGSPVAGASVVLDAGPSRSTATTDASGQAVFAGVGRAAAASGLQVRVTADGYEPARRALDAFPANGVVEVGLRALPVVLTGTVLDRESRMPVPGVVLDFGSGAATDTTDARGNFRVELPRGSGPHVVVIGVRGDTVGVDEEVPVGTGEPIALYFGRSR